MAIFKSKGIVFRTLKYRETSMIVDIYTREKGLRSYLINGVRKAKSRMPAALFQHGNLVEMVAYDKENTSLNRIKEIRSDYPYREIPYKIEKSSVAIFMIEIARNSIKEQEQNLPLFDFLQNRLMRLDQLENGLAIYHLKFLLELASLIGFEPFDNFTIKRKYFNLESGVFLAEAENKSTIDEVKSYFIHELLITDIQDLGRLSIKKSMRMNLIENLLDFYRYHIEGFKEIRSLKVYRQLF